MALLFSAVRATANDQEVEFFVGGIPREYDDLEGWTAFDRFMEDIDEETEVAIHAEAYLYGEEETHRATPEEVAYFMNRIEMDNTFLARCDNIESVDFTINWSPEELFEDDEQEETDTPEEETIPKGDYSQKRNPWTDPNDMHCQYIRGREYLNIESEDFDPEEGIRGLTLSAMQGFDVAMYRLGKVYLQGELVEKNIGEALRWLWEADAKDNPYAQYQLGKLYLKGEDVSSDYATAQRIYNLNEIKSKTVGDGQHGTARFSTKGELRKIYKYIPYEPKVWRKQAKKGKLKLPQGVILGVKKKKGVDYAMVDDDDVHTLMIGAAGCGKTAYWLYPNLEYACAAGMSFLTTDTKGDLYRNYGNIAKQYYGYDVAIIDLRNPTKSDGNNLLHLVNKYMDEYKAHPENIALKPKTAFGEDLN